MFAICNASDNLQAYMGAVISVSMGFSVILLLFSRSLRVIKAASQPIRVRFKQLHEFACKAKGYDYSLPWFKKDFGYYQESLDRKIDGKLLKCANIVACTAMYITIVVSIIGTIVLLCDKIPGRDIPIVYLLPVLISVGMYMLYFIYIMAHIVMMYSLLPFYKKTINEIQKSVTPPVNL